MRRGSEAGGGKQATWFTDPSREVAGETKLISRIPRDRQISGDSLLVARRLLPVSSRNVPFNRRKRT
jgi:hypothetical protein